MVRKKVFNKRAAIVASSLVAIPLTAVLIAAAIHRGRRKSLQKSRFLGQTKSKGSIVTNTAVHKQQQKEKPQAQLQLLGKDLRQKQ